MGNEVFFWTQIGSVIVYVITLFTVYRILVASKDAAIQEKDATIENLKTQLEEAKGRTPDILITQLRDRTCALTEEIERLRGEKSDEKERITELETERDALSKLILRSHRLIVIREALDNPRYEIYREFVTSIYGDAAKASRAIHDFELLDKLVTQSGKKLETTKSICEIRKEDPNFIQASCWADGMWAVYNGEVKVEMNLWEKLSDFHRDIRNEVGEMSENTDEILIRQDLRKVDVQ